MLTLPQETPGPCEEPFTAKSCLERGLRRLRTRGTSGAAEEVPHLPLSCKA